MGKMINEEGVINIVKSLAILSLINAIFVGIKMAFYIFLGVTFFTLFLFYLINWIKKEN